MNYQDERLDKGRTVSITLRSSSIQRYIDQAKAEKRIPISISEVATVVFSLLNKWCEENCQGKWQEIITCYWFELPSDALRFKLANG